MKRLTPQQRARNPLSGEKCCRPKSTWYYIVWEDGTVIGEPDSREMKRIARLNPGSIVYVARATVKRNRWQP